MAMRAIFVALLLFCIPVYAAQVSRVSDLEPGEKIIAQDLSDEFDNIISAINGNISTDNIAVFGVATDNIASAAITKAKLAPLGQQISNASDFTTTSLTDAFVDNLSIVLTTHGRPVVVGLIPDSASSNGAYIGARDFTSFRPDAEFTIRRNATTDIARFRVNAEKLASIGEIYLPPGAIYTIDVPSASDNMYRFLAKALNSNTTASMRSVKIFGYEL